MTLFNNVDYKILPIPEISSNFPLPKVDFHILRRERVFFLIFIGLLFFSLLHDVICKKKNFYHSVIQYILAGSIVTGYYQSTDS
jgi:hypothetical protein